MRNKYSVLYSVYKKEKPSIMKASLDSMLKQTIFPEQIVIVEDGELTGELYELIEEYRTSHPTTITSVPLEVNSGLGVALNEGLKYCRNELVARMDTDDIALPERCEKQLQVFAQDSQLSIVGSYVDEFYDDPEKVVSSRVVPSKHEDIITFSKRRNPFNHPSVMYKKTDVLTAGGYGDFRRNQDYDLFVRMLAKGYRAFNIPEALVLFRANQDNLKRRKSWEKSKGDILMRYGLWRSGYAGFKDFAISSSAFLFSYLAPNWLFKIVSDKFLRKKKVN
ncbi:glycosyltransferase [Jeotgalibaca sp. A122]|uniref:glycosyltransferase n=1 Tax=Jeotgalibaca sp. A122 TaxID=3457322 RepID=UPI003FD339DC